MKTETKTHTEAVKASFNRTADRYDAARRMLIPCFEDFYGAAVALARTDAPAPRILDLGAGTGLYSALLLKAYPHAHLTLLDSADEMMQQARLRFAGDQRVTFRSADYNRYEPNTTYDAVVSALSIHHLSDPDKRRLYARVYDWIRPGGRFVNADQARGGGPGMEAYYNHVWKEQVTDSGLDSAEIAASEERRRLDINAPLSEQLQWLREAGFAEADCAYRHYTFAVFWGWKA